MLHLFGFIAHCQKYSIQAQNNVLYAILPYVLYCCDVIAVETMNVTTINVYVKGKCTVLIQRSVCSTRKALRHGSHSFTCNDTNACLYLVGVHQMAPPQTEFIIAA